jgi:hypothetical protein
MPGAGQPLRAGNPVTRRAGTSGFVVSAVGMAEQTRIARERGTRRRGCRVAVAACAGQMNRDVVRTTRRPGMTVRAFRPIRVVRRVTGTALTVPGEGHFRAMAVLATESRRRGEVDVVPERDVALARFSGHVQREPDRPCRRNGVGAVAGGARLRAGRVMVTCGAVGRRPHARRPVRCAGSVTSTAGQALMPGMLERAADKRRRWYGRHAVLICETGPGPVWRRPSGAHREYGERRCDNELCDAVLGAPPGATAHGGGLVTLLHLHVRRRSQLWP